MTSADLGARLDLRRKSQRRTRLRRAALVLAVSAVLVALGWLVLFSSVLEVREVGVEGNSVTSAEQVTEAAQVPLGTPMARLDGSAIRQRVLGLSPVADVRLRRAWPNRLVIEVTERQMVYQRLLGRSYQWVDEGGTSFHSVPDRAPGLVAVVAGADQRLLRDVATVARALPPEVAEQTGQLEATTVDHIVVVLVDGRRIVWGNAERSGEKAAMLPTLLAMSGTVIDVSAPSHPTVR